MKTIIVGLIMTVLLTGLSSTNSSLKKGSMVSVHVVALKLNLGVNIDEFRDFYTKNAIPEFEKNFPGVREFFIKGIRGEDLGAVGVIYLFESESVRDKYFRDGGIDGIYTELGKACDEKNKTMNEKVAKFVASSSRKFTDWIIQ